MGRRPTKIHSQFSIAGQFREWSYWTNTKPAFTFGRTIKFGDRQRRAECTVAARLTGWKIDVRSESQPEAPHKEGVAEAEADKAVKEKSDDK